MLMDHNVFFLGVSLCIFKTWKTWFWDIQKRIFFLKQMTLFVRVPPPTPIPFEKIKLPEFYYRFQQVGKT